uniref:Uncharacterized protein n=1 Tax=Plectus sambesii TaxID=2011161 RepID=A0A914UTP3_9BILA
MKLREQQCNLEASSRCDITRTNKSLHGARRLSPSEKTPLDNRIWSTKPSSPVYIWTSAVTLGGRSVCSPASTRLRAHLVWLRRATRRLEMPPKRSLLTLAALPLLLFVALNTATSVKEDYNLTFAVFNHNITNAFFRLEGSFHYSSGGRC